MFAAKHASEVAVADNFCLLQINIKGETGDFQLEKEVRQKISMERPGANAWQDYAQFTRNGINPNMFNSQI